MLESDFALHPDKRPTIGPKIIEQLADGQWHGLSEIVKATTAAEAHIHDTLVNIRRHETYEAKCEIRKAGTSDEYRLFKRKKTVGVAELIKKGQ